MLQCLSASVPSTEKKALSRIFVWHWKLALALNEIQWHFQLWSWIRLPFEFFFQIDQDQAYVQTSSSIIVFYIATIDDVTDNCNSNNDHQSIQGFMDRWLPWTGDLKELTKTVTTDIGLWIPESSRIWKAAFTFGNLLFVDFNARMSHSTGQLYLGHFSIRF